MLLKRNPFGELLREERAALACVSTEAPAAFLRAAQDGERRVLQLVADHGRGKSTLLIALQAREFPETPYTQLHGGDGVPMANGPMQFVDSIENLSWLGRRRLYSRCPVLACTTHRDLSRELKSAGYEILTMRIGIKSVEELEDIVKARIAAAQLPDQAQQDRSPPTPSRARLEELYQLHGDDARTIEHALYQDFERLRSEGLNSTPTTHV